MSYANQLEAAGFTAEQAEVRAKGLARIVGEKLATKNDIAMIQREFTEFERAIEEFEERLIYRLTLRWGVILTVAVGVLAVLMKIL